MKRNLDLHLMNYSTNLEIKDQFYYPYQKGVATTTSKPRFDLRRGTNQDFYKTMYNGTQGKVDQNLTEIIWTQKL